jgi:outer membrane receptor protein involved in Fe transport
MQRKIILLLVMLALLSFSLFAQTTGRLRGTVRDERGQAVAWANVILQGTQIGAQTNERGQFTIINITPGVYTVVASQMGYATTRIENVRISLDQDTQLNISLTSSRIQAEEIVIVAEQQLLHRDRAGSGDSRSADEIADIPVSDLSGLVSLTAGVSRGADGTLNVRGGRENEMVFTVDGMSVSDPVDGGRALSVDIDAIKDMKVMTGGFTAEYGNAQSGMVNIVTKDGSENWEGKIEAITDHLFTEGNNYDEIKFALGGPIPVYFFNSELRSKLTFFLNGAAAWDDTRFRKLYRSDPLNEFVLDGMYLMYLNQFPAYDPYADRDKILGWEIGNRNNNNYNLNLKTTYNMSPMQKFTLAFRGDRNYNTPFRHERRYALQHFEERDTRQNQYIFTYDHVFDARRTLQVKGSYYLKTDNRGPRGVNLSNYMWMREGWNDYMYNLDGSRRTLELYDRAGNPIVHNPDDPNCPTWDRRYVGWVGVNSPVYNTINHFGSQHRDFSDLNWVYDLRIGDPRPIPGYFAPGTIWANLIEDESRQYSVRADYEYQVSQIVSAKTGFEVIQHDIKKNQLQGFLSIYDDREAAFLENCIPIGYQVSALGDTIALYSADDYFAAARAASGTRDGYIAKPLQFAYYAQTKIDWEGMIVNAGLRMDMWYLGKDYEILQDEGNYRKRAFNSGDVTQVMFSPRLGVSHPISERDVIHFAYNYQNQLPQMRYIFSSKDSLDARTTPGISVGSPTLEPQITVTYEVGLQRLLTEDYVLGVTAYYKNFYNYVSTKRVIGEDNVSWFEFISEDYGSARGIDISLNRRMFNFLAGGASYSLSWAHGNNSETVIQDETTSLREFPLDWDTRHQFGIYGVFRVGKDEEFTIPFTSYQLPFDDFSVSLNYSIASGRPYTPISEDGRRRLETNSGRKPYTQNADLRMSKNFALGSSSNFIRATFSIENLFKATNVIDVYGRTGSPYYDNADLADTGMDHVWEEVAFMHNKAVRNPHWVNNSRNYIFGLSYNF